MVCKTNALHVIPDQDVSLKRGVLLRIYNQFTQGVNPVVKCFFSKGHRTL